MTILTNKDFIIIDFTITVRDMTFQYQTAAKTSTYVHVILRHSISLPEEMSKYTQKKRDVDESSLANSNSEKACSRKYASDRC